MKKLSELFQLPVSKGDVGVEIECEGQRLVPVMNDKWRSEADNSLRGDFPHTACEWVFAKPLPIGKVAQALQELKNAQEEGRAKLNFSFRTSVHVHINVQQMDVNQIGNMLYTYFLCESVMMHHVDQSRHGNRFCLRMEDAEGMVDYITHLIRSPESDWRHNNPNDAVRYSAMNIEALWKYGSIEFRGMEGNMDVKRIYNWAKAFVNMREFAKQFPDVQHVHDFFVQTRPEEFFKAAVGDVSESFTYEGYVDDLRKGFSLAIDIPYAYRKHVEGAKNPLPKYIMNEVEAAPEGIVGAWRAEFDQQAAIHVAELNPPEQVHGFPPPNRAPRPIPRMPRPAVRY